MSFPSGEAWLITCKTSVLAIEPKPVRAVPWRAQGGFFRPALSLTVVTVVGEERAEGTQSRAEGSFAILMKL